jgi:hypothetical protein
MSMSAGSNTCVSCQSDSFHLTLCIKAAHLTYIDQITLDQWLLAHPPSSSIGGGHGRGDGGDGGGAGDSAVAAAGSAPVF